MIDPVTVQILRNRIASLMDEMHHQFYRSGYSTIIRESRDYSCVITDAEARLAVAPHAFLHATPYHYLIRRVIALYGAEGFIDGDVFVSNHPYEASVPHAPDMAVVAPILAEGELVGFSASIAHKADIGGSVPGSTYGQATELYHEGLLLPPVRLYAGGAYRADLERIIAANSRQAETVLGDLRAQVGVVGMGRERVKRLAAEHGVETIREALAAMIEASGRELAAALRRLPDGRHEAEGFLDSDGVDRDTPVRLHAAVTVEGGIVTFDLTGCDDQRRGPVNLRPALVDACCFHALIGMVDPALRYSDAARESVRIVTRPGSVVDARPPAPVSSYISTCQRLIDVLLAALSRFCPARAAASAGGSGGAMSITWGEGPRRVRGNQYEILGSAYGGGAAGDGESGTTVHITNLHLTPIEIVETEFPCRVERFELIAGSGGAGRHRGGLSARREYVLLQPATVVFRGDRARFAPRGASGGADGRPSRVVLNPGTDRETVLPASFRIELGPGDRLRIEAAGGGGYGDASERDPAANERDRLDGYA